jgi:hypothetical protein
MHRLAQVYGAAQRIPRWFGEAFAALGEPVHLRRGEDSRILGESSQVSVVRE